MERKIKNLEKKINEKKELINNNLLTMTHHEYMVQQRSLNQMIHSKIKLMDHHKSVQGL